MRKGERNAWNLFLAVVEQSRSGKRVEGVLEDEEFARTALRLSSLYGSPVPGDVGWVTSECFSWSSDGGWKRHLTAL